jgi:hypothetical protein
VTRPTGIPREFYDDAVRQRDAALERARIAEDRCAAVVKELVELKRHDIGALPGVHFNTDSLDPAHGLGPKTALAVDEFADGDVELRARLLARAHVLTASAKMQYGDDDPGAIDKYVAHLIQQGDTG